MHNPETVLENQTQKILRDFEIKLDHQVPNQTSRPSDSQKMKEEPGE